MTLPSVRAGNRGGADHNTLLKRQIRRFVAPRMLGAIVLSCQRIGPNSDRSKSVLQKHCQIALGENAKPANAAHPAALASGLANGHG
jgi:hypothetical protein